MYHYFASNSVFSPVNIVNDLNMNVQ
ncbi:MAG: dUTP diphosphatase, partial [Bacteroides oleiciplenus]|nr:dUTP diphosphatase [Bacteroides oleiciplenus]